MPLHEYECGACGHRFEAIQKFSDSPLDTCPKCGGALRKLQSAPAFHLKGSGWYLTDYAKKESPETKAEGGSKAEDGSKDSAPSGKDKNAAAKAETSSPSTSSTPSSESSTSSSSTGPTDKNS